MHSTTATGLLLLFHAPFELMGLQSPARLRVHGVSTGQSLFGMAGSTTNKKLPGTAQVAWDKLGFGLVPTNSHVKLTYTERSDGTGGDWSEPELVQEPYINLHIAATALHYGQSCLEGLKAYCHADGTVHLFRPTEHAMRMQETCRRILMPELPVDTFVQAMETVIRDNIEYVPPHGSNGALYIRPLMFGSGPRVGVQPANEYTFIAMVVPAGSYYAGGLGKPVDGLIMSEYDRAAPKGVGGVKVAGNYAADMLPSKKTKEAGYQIALYLDSRTQESIEEFSTSSFVGINAVARKYVTPQSASVLRSVTNNSLMQLAADMEGWTVERRDISVKELASFHEVMAVGTGGVVTPVGSITQRLKEGESKVFHFGKSGVIGTVTQRLYNALRGIQNGDTPDVYRWNHKVDF